MFKGLLEIRKFLIWNEDKMGFILDTIKVIFIWNMVLREEIGMEILRVNCWSFSGENIICLR